MKKAETTILMFTKNEVEQALSLLALAHGVIKDDGCSCINLRISSDYSTDAWVECELSYGQPRIGKEVSIEDRPAF